MQVPKVLNLLVLTALTACASKAPEVVQTTPVSHYAHRSIANDQELGVSQTKVQKLLKGIFHSYLLGQVLLFDFDKQLDSQAKDAMKSDSYHDLIAIRTLVDGFEEDVNDLYMHLVLVSALPKYSSADKKEAEASLKTMGEFFEGILTNKQQLPENLKPLILSNLTEKQTTLYDELMALKNDPAVTNNDPAVIDVIHKNMVLLRATRRSYNKDIARYQVNQSILNQAVSDATKDSDFRQFKKTVRKLSRQMRRLQKEVGGRSTSSDSIFPSAGASGNITGRGFPANTWSLTYDDGPGGKTTPTVLKNLKARKQKATFFMLAKQVEALPNIAKSIAADGHDLASHSYDHAQLTKVSATNLEKQIGGSKKIIEEKLGTKIKLFRLPYGAGVSTSAIRAKIAQHDMIHVFWNVDTLDWQDKNPTSIFNRAVKQMKAAAKNSGVVLFHDIHPQSVTASTMLMDYFKEQNIKVCPVQAVVDQINQGKENCN